MSQATVIRRTVSFRTAGRGASALPAKQAEDKSPSASRVPRIARLLALAIHFDEHVRRGGVRD